MGVGGGGRVWERYCTAQSKKKKGRLGLSAEWGSVKHPSFPRMALDVQTHSYVSHSSHILERVDSEEARHIGPLFRDKPALTEPEDSKS